MNSKGHLPFGVVAEKAGVSGDQSTERAAQSAALEREAFVRSVLDAVGVNLAVLDRNGLITSTNLVWRQFALENGDASGGAATGVGVNYLAVVRGATGPSPEGAAEALTGIEDTLAGRVADFTIEYPCHSPDQQRWFMMRATPLAGEKGGAVLAHIDITERKHAEYKLEASETRYRRLFESAKDGILILDADTGQIVDVNPFMIALLGYAYDEFVGKHLWEIGLFKDVVASQDAFRELRAKEYVRYEDLPLEAKDGREVAVEFVSNVYKVNSTSVIQCNIRDVTERQKAEAAQRQLHAQLVQSQKLESIGTLASGVAHEINNPIMGIMNYAQLIRDRLGPENPVSEYAVEIGIETERVAMIVKNLLTFAHQDKQGRSPANMSDIVNATMSLTRAVLRHDQIRLTVDVSEILPQLLCRSQQIQQVLMNLLTNARDALNERYPAHDENKVIRISAEVIRDQSSVISHPLSVTTVTDHRSLITEFVRLTVEDHGVGIPPEVCHRIFDPFFTTKPKDKGTGLGLSISHSIVKDHGGELHVESEPGQWTRFRVDLPVAYDAMGRARRKDESSP